MKQIRKTNLLLTFAFAAITFISCDEKIAVIDPTEITTVTEETYADTDF